MTFSLNNVTLLNFTDAEEENLQAVLLYLHSLPSATSMLNKVTGAETLIIQKR